MDAVSIYERFPNEGAVIDAMIEARFGGPHPYCVHCGESNVERIDDRLFRCRPCQKKFSVLKGTIFERTKVDLRKWLYALLKISANGRKGISSCELARDISVRQATAWKMLTKIREAMKRANSEVEALRNIVEVDEVFIGGKPRRLNSKWVTEKPKPKTPVVTFVERPAVGRPGRARVFVPQPDHKGRRLTAPTMTDAVLQHVDTLAEVHTDEAPHYHELKSKGFLHETVLHNRRYVGEFGHNHINSAESFHAIVKRAHRGIYHQYAPGNVAAYMEECAYRWNRREEKPTFEALVELAVRGPGEEPKRKREPWPPPMGEDGQMELF